VNALDYHWLFWLPMILTVAAAVAAVLFVPESPVRTPGRISWVPALLLSAWLVALLVALSQAPAWGWGSARVLGLLAAAVVLAVAWVAAELRAATPLIDMKMMRRTAAAMASIVTSSLAATGLPLESGYTTGFAAMTGALVLAAGAGLLIPAVRRMRPQSAAEPEQTGQAELSLASEGE
jgi:hypothetical protein